MDKGSSNAPSRLAVGLGVPSAAAASLFADLARISSPSGQERAVADFVHAYLRRLSLETFEDDAGARIGTNAGNVSAWIGPSGGNGGTPIFLCAHLDTVPPDGPIEPVIEGGCVRNARPTILGADNKAAVAVMLESTRRILAQQRPHSGIELLFVVGEETGSHGARALDLEGLHSRIGFVYDYAGPIGQIVIAAPYHFTLDFSFHGRAAHAGINPEEGRSAIRAAALAITGFQLGRIDPETTANVGALQGGGAGNAIPHYCAFSAEVRSHNRATLSATVEEMCARSRAAAEGADCTVEIAVNETYAGYRFDAGAAPIRLASRALQRTGFTPEFIETNGGADANYLNSAGLQCGNLANGMANIHSEDEYIAVADLERMVDVTLELVEAARDEGTQVKGSA